MPGSFCFQSEDDQRRFRGIDKKRGEKRTCDGVLLGARARIAERAPWNAVRLDSDIEDSCGSESYCRHVEEIVREGTGDFLTYSATAGIIEI